MQHILEGTVQGCCFLWQSIRGLAFPPVGAYAGICCMRATIMPRGSRNVLARCDAPRGLGDASGLPPKSNQTRRSQKPAPAEEQFYSGLGARCDRLLLAPAPQPSSQSIAPAARRSSVVRPTQTTRHGRRSFQHVVHVRVMAAPAAARKARSPGSARPDPRRCGFEGLTSPTGHTRKLYWPSRRVDR
jgi:hypothetical protein